MDENIFDKSDGMERSFEKGTDREHHAGLHDDVDHLGDASNIEIESEEAQIFSMREIDPVLDAKMRLVNKV